MADTSDKGVPMQVLPVSAGPRFPMAPVTMPPLIAPEHRDLLCALAYVALGVGDNHQAVTLLDLVLRDVPDDAGALRLMAYARVAAGDGEAALDALDRLDALRGDPDDGTPAPLLLLRSQGLRLAGRLDEGKATFQRFLAARRGRASTREIAA